MDELDIHPVQSAAVPTRDITVGSLILLALGGSASDSDSSVSFPQYPHSAGETFLHHLTMMG